MTLAHFSPEDVPAPPGKTGWPWTESSPQAPAAMKNGRAWPRISIVTPSYNQAQFVEETIRSVLLQGYPNLEYIIMDGGSTDGSVEVIRKYEPWLSYVHVGPDGGQSAAIAEGFRYATGDILAWINSDDRYLAGAFVRAAAFFDAHPKVVFANGDVNSVGEHGEILNRNYVFRPLPRVTVTLGQHKWPQQGCFWRRAAYERVGGVDGSLQFCMDRDLFVRLAQVGPSSRIPGPPLADFRDYVLTKSGTMQDVARREGELISNKYASPRDQRLQWLLYWQWRFWRYSAALRAHLQRRFGWEF